MKWTVLFVGLTYLTATQSVAQTTVTTSEAFWGNTLPQAVTERQALLSGQLTNLQPGSASDQVVLRQQGNGNQAYYRGGATNQSNRVVLNQNGDGNLLNVSLKGSQNTYLLDQQGNANSMQLADMQGDKLNVQIRQAGNANELRLANDAFSNVTTTVGAIRIEQSGGARATITSTYFRQ
jgi:hypothetical protein